MKTSKIIAAAALSLLAAAGAAQAEEYEGVLTVQSTLSRAELQQQAIAAARQSNAYGDASGDAARALMAGQLDRATVRAEAVAAAHSPTANLDAKSFVNSQIPAQYTHGSLAQRRGAERNASL
ncbi:MAG: alpha/beta hydrolase [Xenophilus sp.]